MSKGRRKKSSFETSAEPRVNAQRFENIQAAMKESIDSIEVDSKRREIFRDAVNQSDTVYELGLLATFAQKQEVNLTDRLTKLLMPSEQPSKPSPK